MSIWFRSGVTLHQKGRGIGGFFRGLASIFKPIVQSVGKTAIKAVKSKTAREIASNLSSQAIDSGLNMTKDLIQGGDLKKSFENEQENFKKVGMKIINDLQNKRKKQPNNLQHMVKKRKTTLKTMNQYEWL